MGVTNLGCDGYDVVDGVGCGLGRVDVRRAHFVPADVRRDAFAGFVADRVGSPRNISSAKANRLYVAAISPNTTPS
jgi:hypothetical protein